ncbi:hypothetical protein A311_01282 [Escherichia coli KTE146]|nr:hypothetical protein A311_01282 [Escherichia coli KTE146]
MTAISTRRSTSNARAYWNYKRRGSSFLPMEASVNPSHRRLRLKKWEASPDRTGSSHKGKIKRERLRSPIIGYFAGLLRGTVGFGIDIIVNAITGLDFFIDIRAATIFAHGVLVLFIFGHAVIVH